MQTKMEVYRFVSSECGAYVPPYDNVTIWHLKYLAADGQARIKAKDIMHINVPHFEGLTLKEMKKYGDMYPQVIKCLPQERKEWDTLPR